MDNVPVGQSYQGPSGVGRDSLWLTAEDLVEGKDENAQIEDVVFYREVTFEKGRVKNNLLGLKFSGKKRILLLNATNRKVLNRMFGNITKGWKGQTITLFVSDTNFAGQDVKCVRVRNQRSRAASAAEEFIAGNDEPVPGADPEDSTPTAVGAEPARLTDAEACSVLASLATRATKSFGGERLFLKEVPKKSGSIWTCDPELAIPEVQVWIGGENRLAVSRDRLAELTTKLEALLA